MNHLALQVSEVDTIVIVKDKMSNTTGSEICGYRRTKPTYAYKHGCRVKQAFLTIKINFRKQ
jgi:hypothetical protein